MHGWVAAKSLNIECLGEFRSMGNCRQYSNLLNKFPKDQIFFEDNQSICFLNGYVHNKIDFLKENSLSWSESFTRALQQDIPGSLKKLRGGFCGYLFDKSVDIVVAYTDQSAVKPLYYYVDGDRWMLSDHLEYMAEVLKSNNIVLDFNILAAEYMLSYGYMIDDNTFIKQIHRLLPGEYVCIKRGKAIVTKYYAITDIEVQMSEEEAIEKIDAAFREAIRREFEKDKEYGYRHLVDLSGGLDSRMVSWVAHDMGYTDQVNIAYSQAGYYDERISKELAAYLGHEYLFKPLDNAEWMYDLEEIISANNGAALYMGITGGDRMLRLLNMGQFGIEHTGMLGDAVIGTLYHDRKLNYGKPMFGKNQYSDKLKYQFHEKILEGYSCQEMFGIYTRGMLGAASSYMIRQQYVETSSPFLDVDFADTAFSISFDYRKSHHIYLKWIKAKYPKAADFGWEKWGGIKPKESHIFFRKVKTTQRLLWQAICRGLNIENRDSMNPVDYWYQHDKNIQQFLQEYYDKNINNRVLGEALKKDISRVFHEGNVSEKSMALTVLAMARKYFV